MSTALAELVDYVLERLSVSTGVVERSHGRGRLYLRLGNGINKVNSRYGNRLRLHNDISYFGILETVPICLPTDVTVTVSSYSVVEEVRIRHEHALETMLRSDWFCGDNVQAARYTSACVV